MTGTEKPDQEERKPKFKRSRQMPKMPPENAKRQGAITTLAFTQFGDRDLAVAFLNDHHRALDARPLDIASASSEGFERVSSLIASEAD